MDEKIISAEYEARKKRVADAVAVKTPDRVPFIPVMEAFPVYYGGKTIKQCMYDYRQTESCFDRFFTDFKPDLGWDPIMIFPAEVLERIGITWFRWPGHGIKEDNVMYQFIEDEYMKEDEYDEAIKDITNYMTTKWFPRSFSAMQGFKKLYTRNAMWFGFLGTFAAFDDEVIESMQAAADSARMLSKWFGYLDGYKAKMKDKFGVPVAYGGFAYAPFDMIGDSMRGTPGILTDLYDRPDKLLALIDNVTEFAIEDMIKSMEGAVSPYVWFWLHKGVDSFMSDEMYKKFYWPSLKKYITALTEKGIVPVVYCEGSYHTRLDYLKELPGGKVVLDFEDIDMAKAKKELGKEFCIAGNLPNYLLTYGTAKEIDEYVKRLCGTCADGGGFMFDTGALIDDCRFENFAAMYEAVNKYGKY